MLLSWLPYEAIVPWNATDIALDPVRPILYAAVPSENAIKLLHSDTLEPLGEFRVGDDVSQLAVSPDGSWVYGYYQHSPLIHAIDRSNGDLVSTTPSPKAPITLLAGHDGLLYLQSWESAIHRLNPATGAWSQFGRAIRAYEIALNPVANIIYRDEGTGVFAYDIKLQSPVGQPTGFRSLPTFSTDGRLAVAATDSSLVRYVVDAQSYLPVSSVVTNAWRSALSPEGTTLYTTPAWANDLLAWNLETSQSAGHSGAMPYIYRIVVNASNTLVFVQVSDESEGGGQLYVFPAVDRAVPDGFAHPGANPLSLAMGRNLTLDASRSFAPVGASITEYAWDLNNDGIFGDASGVRPTVTWTQLESLGLSREATTPIRVRISGPGFEPIVSRYNFLSISKALAEPGLTLSASHAKPGDTLTVHVAMPRTAITPTGTIELYRNDSRVGTATLDAEGKAIFNVPLSTAGNHVIRAVYGGDAAHQDTASSKEVKVRNPVQLTLTPSNDTVTVRGTADGRALQGKVDFFAKGNYRATVALNAAGEATLSLAWLPAGNHLVEVKYHETDLNAAATVARRVDKPLYPTRLELSRSDDTITIRGTVEDRALQGHVNLYVDGVFEGFYAFNYAGEATLSLAGLPAGEYPIEARYAATAVNAAASSSMSVKKTLTPTITSFEWIHGAGALVRVSAAAGPAPTGTVLLWSGETLLQAGTVGVAFSFSQLPPSVHQIRAEYIGGGRRWEQSVSPTHTLDKRKSPSLEALASTNSVDPGGRVIISVAVRSQLGIVSGPLEVVDGDTLLGTGWLSNGVGEVDVIPVGVGSRLLTVRYGGDAMHSPTSGLVNVNIRQGPVIDVLFLVTPAALSYGGTDFAIDKIIARTNTILRESLVAAEVRSAGWVTVPYTESGNPETDLTRMMNPRDGHIDNVNALRDAYGADVVTLLISAGTSDTIGVAYTPDSMTKLRTNPTPFIVMEQQYHSTTLFAHEFAHLFGAKHDYKRGERAIAPDAFGYSFKIGDQTYTDIMSYVDGALLPYYSNPDVYYWGVPVGVAGRANVARVISEGAPFIAGYRPSNHHPLVAAPVTLSASASHIHRGQSITFTLTGASSGTVQFYAGQTCLGSVEPVNGVATLTTTQLGEAATTFVHAMHRLSDDVGVVSQPLAISVSQTTLLPGGVLHINGTPHNDVITAVVDEERLYVTVNGYTTDHLLTSIEYIVVTAGDGDDVIDLRTLSIPARIEGGAGNDAIVGTLADDTINAGAGNDTVYANAGNDIVDGGDGDDLLSGQWGDDTIRGGAGHDSIYGDDGDDLLYGGDGNDLILGGAGHDTIYGNFGADTLLGGTGNDEIFGGIGRDSINGGAGNDTLYGGNGADIIRGGDGDDYIIGKGKADTLYGGTGHDTIYGAAGDDLIFGGTGDDWIYVHDGPTLYFRDTVDGGDGYDRVHADEWTVLFDAEELLA